MPGVNEDGDELVALELFRMIFDEVLYREIHYYRVRGQKGQFEDFDSGKPARCVPRQGPGDVHDTVVGLVDQRRRLTAQVHRGVDVDLQASAGIRFDLFHPGRQHHGVAGRHGRQHVMRLQADFLGADRRGGGSQSQEDYKEVFHHPLILTDAIAHRDKKRGARIAPLNSWHCQGQWMLLPVIVAARCVCATSLQRHYCNITSAKLLPKFFGGLG